MHRALDGKRIAILIEEGFAAREVVAPRDALAALGATVVLVGPTAGASYADKTGAHAVTADVSASTARMRDFDALIIPGGHAPDRMRLRHAMVDLVAEAMATEKPVGAICHGPQLLISANALRGRQVTCWPSIAVDVKNAGGRYVDRPVVRDRNLITSRKGDDVPLFTAALVEALAAPAG